MPPCRIRTKLPAVPGILVFMKAVAPCLTIGADELAS